MENDDNRDHWTPEQRAWRAAGYPFEELMWQSIELPIGKYVTL